MATKEIRALTNCLATCLGLTLYRFCQCALYGPLVFEPLLDCGYLQSGFLGPYCDGKRFSAERQNAIIFSSLLARRSRQCFLDTPSMVETVLEGLAAHSKMLCPVRQGHGLAVVSNKLILRSRCPWGGCQSFLDSPTSTETGRKGSVGHVELPSPLGEAHSCAIESNIPQRDGCGHQRFFNRPSSLDTPRERRCWDSRLISPVCDALCRTVESYEVTGSFIPRLFCGGGPTAIGFRIAQLVIDPFQRMIRGRPWSHVEIECLKRFPFGADRDSASAVSIVGCILGTAATVVHAVKCSVFGSSTHTVRCIVALGRIGIAHQKNLLLRFGWWEGPGWSYNLLLGPCYFSTPVIREQR